MLLFGSVLLPLDKLSELILTCVQILLLYLMKGDLNIYTKYLLNNAFNAFYFFSLSKAYNCYEYSISYYIIESMHALAVHSEQYQSV